MASMSFRSFRASAAAVLVAVAVGACGGGGPSTPSPANTVPAGAAFYMSVTVQPSTTVSQELQQVVNKIGGQGTASRLLTKLKQALAKPHNGVSFDKDVQPWLGHEIGVAITKWPPKLSKNGSSIDPYVAVVFPTAHPDIASKDLPILEKSGMPKGMAAKVTGNYLLLGGKQAVAALASTSSGNSLASSSSYQADLAKLGANPLAVAYVNMHSLPTLLAAAARGNGGNAAPLSALLPKFPAGAAGMAGVSVTGSTVQLDIASAGTNSSQPASAPADVSGLPGNSWLAVGTPAVSAKQLQSAMKAMNALSALNATSMGHGTTSKGATTSSPSAHIAKTTKSLSALQGFVPLLFKSGLGQMHLSVAGLPNQGLQAGFSLAEPDSTAADKLVRLIYQIASMGKANLSGTASSFTITASPKLKVNVGNVGNEVVATTGYSNASAFTSPGSTLAGNSVYQQAVSQLPSGSDVPAFVNLTELSSLVSHDPKLAKQPFAKVLSRFSYLIVGESSGDTRIVLGLS